MANFDFKIPGIGKIISYVYDFCTYKKRWNVFIDYESISNPDKDGWIKFTIRLTNETDHYIEIKSLLVKGELVVGSSEVQTSSNDDFVFINPFGVNYNKPLNLEEEKIVLLPKGNKAKSIKKFHVKYQGDQTKLIVGYRIKDAKKSWLFSDKRESKRYLPI